MKISVLFAASALAASTVALAAQQSAVAAGQTTAATAPGVQAHESSNAAATARPGSVAANGSAGAGAEMRPVKGELVGKLDSKSARAGDTVVVKTKEKMKTADGVEIPKGSRLIGHVTQVEAHGHGHADSSMGLAFDRAELKGGRQIAIHSVIQSVAPPASAVASSAFEDDDALSAPIGGGAGGGVRAAGAGRAGSGLLGGAAGATTSAAGGLDSNLNRTTGGTLHATNGVAGEATNGVSGGLDETTGATGSLAAHATGIPGVMLAGSTSNSLSGSLSEPGKNIHLDSGTQMVLGIAVSPAAR